MRTDELPFHHNGTLTLLGSTQFRNLTGLATASVIGDNIRYTRLASRILPYMSP